MSEHTGNKEERKEKGKKKPSVLLRTYGCQMNEYDSEIIKSILSDSQFSFADNEIDADIILLNTCAVRENAQRKVFGLIHDIKHRREGKPAFFGVLGCIATHLKQDLLDNKNINIDFIVGPDSYKNLPDIINETIKKHKKTLDINLSELEDYSGINPKREASINAWIAVMRGCNNFCTFCVVPYTRGRERSRSVESIVKEAQKASYEGMKQVTLLGQNVNSYKHAANDFSDLLLEVNKIEGIERIRFTSPHR